MADHNHRRYVTQHQRSSSTGSHGLLFGIGAAGGAHHVVNHHHLIPHQQANNFSPETLSDEDELENSAYGSSPDLKGTLSKWTNYIHGWQDRYMALKDRTIVYYKSEFETDFGCRGAISIDKATIKPHEIDELRFDVSVSDCVWYLRARSVEDRQKWIDTLEAAKKCYALNSELGAGGSGSLAIRRHDSALSLTSTASLRKGNHTMYEKLAEIETFKDILSQQIDKLGAYIDQCAKHGVMPDEPVVNSAYLSDDDSFESDLKKNVLKKTSSIGENTPNGKLNPVDFKAEAITFKATASGILFNLTSCIEILSQREEQWRKKYEREQIARRRIEEKYRSAVEDADVGNVIKSETPSKAQMMAMSNPDFEEGPNSQIGEDEFFDAVETALDKLQEEQEYRDKLKLMGKSAELQTAPVHPATQHPLWQIIDEVTNEQLHYARIEVGSKDSIWELFAEDGEMRMYKREEEVDGMVVDPLKALHQVKGVTAHELCHYFFAPEVRMEWETTVEQATVLEKIADDTLVFLQLHKRVWPAAQRDALFWSHMRRIPRNKDNDGVDETWIVCNQSTKHPDAPENQGGCLRVHLTVIFVCDTIIDPGFTKETAKRENITTKITYCSVVNPGGWAPASVLRAVYKREYPRFLKRFTQYVDDKSRPKPIQW